MEYPKDVMTISELHAAFPNIGKRNWYAAARNIYYSGYYTFKTPGGGKIFFDTAKFEKYRTKVFRFDE